VKPANLLHAFAAGVRAEIPLLIGVLPFGMIYGILAIGAGLPAAAAQLMSSVVFAGSSQFVAAQLFQTQTPPLVIVLTIAVVNLRHALYSASLAPFIRQLSLRWKMFLAYLLTDEAFAVGILNYYASRPGQQVSSQVESGEPDGLMEVQTAGSSLTAPHAYYIGAGLGLWTTWQISTAIGITMGAAVPAEWPLDFTLPLTFIALMVPTLKDRPAVAAAISAGVVALVAYNLPFRLGLMAAALVGIVVGVVVEARS